MNLTSRRGRKRKWRDPASTTVNMEKDEYILLTALFDGTEKNFSDVFHTGCRAFLDDQFSSNNIPTTLLPLYQRILSNDVKEVEKVIPPEVTESEQQEEQQEKRRRSAEDRVSGLIAESIRDDIPVSELRRYHDWFNRAQSMRSTAGETRTVNELLSDFKRNYLSSYREIHSIFESNDGEIPESRHPFVIRLAIAQLVFEEVES